MTHPDAYPILERPCRAEIRVKGSRFLALGFPVSTEEETDSIRRQLATEHRDASHLCWALRLGPSGEALERHSDAGEPAGSAGPPIARALAASGLSDLIVIVLRWFGGTKLGVGGLIRAYGEAAALALAQASSGQRLLSRRLTGSLPFDLEGELRALVARHEGRILRVLYSAEGFELELELPCSSVEAVKSSVRDLGRGRFELRDAD